MDITIVIPTKNAGNLLDKILTKIESQETSFQYEIICVDSGSTDNTLSIIKRHKNVSLFQISPEEFGHGKTRNFGASCGTGEFIVFLTQDAMPASNTWLDNLVSSVHNNEKCAGAFGIHYAYENCNVFDKRDLQLHFLRFGDKTVYFRLDADNKELYDNDQGYRAYLDFYSDNNSCMRRKVWEKVPYDDVDFAEDQLWAAKILRLGYEKGYCPFAPVYHSHDYLLSTYFFRYYDEFKALYRIQGFCLVNNLITLFPNIIGVVLKDIAFLYKQKNISFKHKVYWTKYSFLKNTYRYLAGWLSVKYCCCPKVVQHWLDKKLSQQLIQRRS